jgi:hypothetical protein
MAEAFDAAHEEGEGREAHDENEEGRRLDRVLGEPAHGEAAAAPGCRVRCCSGGEGAGLEGPGESHGRATPPTAADTASERRDSPTRHLILSIASRCVRVAARALTSVAIPAGVGIVCYIPSARVTEHAEVSQNTSGDDIIVDRVKDTIYHLK